MSRTQIAERLDAGDRAGAVRLAARQQITKLKKVQKSELDLQLAALEELVRRFPQINSEFYGSQLRQSLAELGLKGTCVEEMETALAHVQEKLTPVAEYDARRQARPRQTQQQAPAPPATTVQPEPEDDSLTAEAKQLIAQGRVSRESIAQMSAQQYERALTSPLFNKCLEILEPRRAPSPLTLGELQEAHGRAHRMNQQGQTVITADVVRAVEESKRAHWTSINQDPPPMPSPNASRSAVVNLERAMPVPKSLSAREIAEGRRQETADHAFIDSAREKTARRRRVLGNGRG
jgi:hypothetical protein